MKQTDRKSPGHKRGMRSGEIADRLRARILDGTWLPGITLPARTALIDEYGSTAATVQQAMNILMREGFTRVNGRQATYVADRPPHRYRYAMVFAEPAGWIHANRFFHLLEEEASRRREDHEDPRCVEVHYGVEHHADNLEMRALARAVSHRALAGLILPGNPLATGLGDSPLCRSPHVPCVAFAPTGESAHWSSVRMVSFLEKAITFLAESGCRQVAVLTGHSPPARWQESIDAAVGACGLRTRPYWSLLAHREEPHGAAAIMRLLFQAAPPERPDGLVIADDNLVEDALAGIVAAGVRVPETLRIAAHCNFPWSIPSVVPVTRIGFCAQRLLDVCLAELERQQHGDPPRQIEVEPIFEDEITQTVPAMRAEPDGEAR